MPDRHCSSRHGRRVRPRRASHVPAGVVRRRQPQCNAQFFLGVDDQFGALELVAQTTVVALQLLDLSCRSSRLRPSPFWRQRRLIGPADLLAPGRDHRGVDALAPQERPERTDLLAPLGLGEQPLLLAPGEIAPPGDRNDLRVTARRFRRAPSPPSGETISPVALRAPSATVSPEEPDNPSKEDFNNEVMCMSYLYSKLPETGVSPHIDTGGHRASGEDQWNARTMQERSSKGSSTASVRAPCCS